MMPKCLPYICLLVLCVGCHLGPDYKVPEKEIPSAWKNGEAASIPPTPPVCYWWEVFGDDALNALEEQAILNNPNLFAALDKVAKARAIVGVDKAALYPQVNLYPSYSNTGTLFKIYPPPGGFPFPGGNILDTPYRIHQLQYSVPFTMNYELDLWGKLKGQYDSAFFSAQAQTENFKNALLTLTADVASDYFRLRTLDAQIVSYGKILVLLRKNLGLIQSRYDKGLVSYQDVAAAIQVLGTTEAGYYDTLRQRALMEDAIATLTGTPASEFSIESNPIEGLPPQIPPNLPSDVLLQRPDVAAAERIAASNQAMIGVAYASFFPAISLTGTLGYFSPELRNFMLWKSRLWSLGADAAQTIFDGGRNQSNLDLAYANFRQASHEYQQTVLTAFQEVEDALASVELLAKEYESYQKASEGAQKRIQLSNHRFNQGLVFYLEVIDSEQTGIQVEISAIGSLGARYDATIKLIKALGGSWKTTLDCEQDL